MVSSPATSTAASSSCSTAASTTTAAAAAATTTTAAAAAAATTTAEWRVAANARPQPTQSGNHFDTADVIGDDLLDARTDAEFDELRVLTGGGQQSGQRR